MSEVIRRRVFLRTRDRMLWYVVEVEHALEHFVLDQVKRLGLTDVLLPMLMKKYSNGTVAIKPLLPGYVFVKFNVTSALWRKIYTLQGVTGLLGWGKEPQPVPVQEMRRLMRRAVEVNGKAVLRPGDLVEVADGTNESLQVTVKSLTSTHVEVELALFGKLVAYKFRLDEVRRVK